MFYRSDSHNGKNSARRLVTGFLAPLAVCAIVSHASADVSRAGELVLTENEYGWIETSGDEELLGRKGGAKKREAEPPSSYIPDREALPAVRDQGKSSLCWAFSGLDSGLINSGADISGLYSPGHLGWCTLGEKEGEGWHLLNGASWFTLGGNYYMLSGTLLKYEGAVYESAFNTPYTASGANVYSLTDDERKMSVSQLTGFEKLQDLRYLAHDSAEFASALKEIKKAVMKNGSVTVNINALDYREEDNVYLGTRTAINHAVTVVGWDDDLTFDGADVDGAFIVKNSYGEEWGDGGYCYLSYAEPSISSIVVYHMTVPGENDHPVSYYHTGTGYYSWYKSNGITGCANVFRAEEDTLLESVGTYCPAGGTYSAEVRVYSEGEDPFAGEPLGTVSGGSASFAFVNARFDEAVMIKKGQFFSVSASVKDADGNDIFFVEGPTTKDAYTLSHETSCGEGESFLFFEGEGYKDIKDTIYAAKNNICLYAFGQAVRKEGWVDEEDGRRYYENGEAVTGWHTDPDGQVYYLTEPTGLMAEGWLSLDGKWYLFGSSLRKGWHKRGGKWYYLDSVTGEMRTGIVTVGGKRYAILDKGYLAVGRWFAYDGNWYLTDANGELRTSCWKKTGGKWYRLGADGRMLFDTTAVIGGVTYTFDADGALVD